jgi:hypothetical protein
MSTVHHDEDQDDKSVLTITLARRFASFVPKLINNVFVIRIGSGWQFSGFSLLSSSKGGLFLFDEGCAFAECALLVKPGSWESIAHTDACLASTAQGVAQPSSKVFFLIIGYSCQVNQIF